METLVEQTSILQAPTKGVSMRRRIGTRLIASFLIGVVITIIVGAIAMIALDRVNNNANTLINVFMKELNLIDDLATDLAGARRYEKEFFLFSEIGNPAKQEEYHDKLQNAWATLAQDAGAFQQLPEESEAREHTDDLTQLVARSHQGVTVVEDLMMAGRSFEDVQPQYLEYRSAVRELEDLVSHISQHTRHTINVRQERLIETQAILGKLVVGTVVVAVILAVLMGIAITRSITGPVRRLSDITKRIAVGDLTERVKETTEDELGELSASFNHMTETLQKSMCTVQEKSRELDAQNEELRAANEELQVTEVELSESEERNHLLLDSAGEAIYGLDVNGNCTFANPACLRQLGYGREEDVLGKNMHDLMHCKRPDGTPYPKEDCKIYEVLKKGKGVHVDDEVLWRADGTSFPAEYSSYPMHKEGKVVGAVMVFGDITERKQAEAREKQLQQELNLSSRLASVGEMASGIAHEINNPLTSVIGFSQLLLSRGVADDVKRDLEVINSQSQRVAKIVAGLLTFARQQKPGKEHADINSILMQVLNLRSYEMEVNNIEVLPQLTLDLPLAIADAGQLQQVFLNIIINAEKEMTRANNRGRLIVKTEKKNDVISISFTDDGPGIDKENLGRIFDPFFTTREVGEGTGLGLSICHGIITEHKGRIYAESELGKGATFIIELPIVADTEQSEDAEVVQEETWQGRGSKILVVDDEKMILEFLKCLLTDEGYEVDTVGRASTALERINDERYDLILLDIKLPGMNGIELYQHIKETNPVLTEKISFIIGAVMETTTKEFLDRTGAAYIPKPIDIERLKKEVNSVLTKSLERQRT